MRTVNLVKGQNTNLLGATKIIVEISWKTRDKLQDETRDDWTPPELDAALFLLDERVVARDASDFVFYNNPDPHALNGCAQIKGAWGSREPRLSSKAPTNVDYDNPNCDLFEIDLTKVPNEVESVEFVLAAYQSSNAADKGVFDFRSVESARFRIVDSERDKGIANFDLYTEDRGGRDDYLNALESSCAELDPPLNQTVLLGALYRRAPLGADWSVVALGLGYDYDLAKYARVNNARRSTKN